MSRRACDAARRGWCRRLGHRQLPTTCQFTPTSTSSELRIKTAGVRNALLVPSDFPRPSFRSYTRAHIILRLIRILLRDPRASISPQIDYLRRDSDAIHAPDERSNRD